MNTTKTITTLLLATIACYCLSTSFITWALPPGQVSIPHLTLGMITGTLAYLTLKTSNPSNTTT